MKKFVWELNVRYHLKAGGKSAIQEDDNPHHVATEEQTLESLMKEIPKMPKQGNGFIIEKLDILSAKYLFELKNFN